jgi:putative SOS response-associated peptidase YedK
MSLIDAVSPAGKVVETCSIRTTMPNAEDTAMHDKMPVILIQMLVTSGSIWDLRR